MDDQIQNQTILSTLETLTYPSGAGQFAYRNLPLYRIPLYRMLIIPNVHYTEWSLHRMVIIPNGHYTEIPLHRMVIKPKINLAYPITPNGHYTEKLSNH